jgi:uncharacterized protein
MKFIHCVNSLPRLVSGALADRLAVMPAVVVTGARQTGKSTLVEQLVQGERLYRTLDDFDVLDAARRDPEALVGGHEPITLDEVQREPGLLSAVKRAIDRNRSAGRFLLTGSANLLLMRQVSESLAGRASYLTLWPMTRREQLGLGRAGRWEELLDTPDEGWRDLLAAGDEYEEDWRALAYRGGFPTPAIELARPAERAIWFDGYVRTYLERDLQDLATISSLPDFRRLMQAACLRLGQLLNQTELGRDVALPQPTVHRWLNLLETSYLLVRLPAYAVNRTKRLIKAPKLYWGDTGIALHRSRRPGGTGVLAHDHRRGGGFCYRGREQAAADRSQGDGLAAAGGLRPPAHLPRGVRQQGPSGPPAAHRQQRRMAHPRCAGGAVVASALTIMIESIPRVVMISEASAVSFRQNLGDMLNQVQYRHDSIVIKRDGKPVAALVDARLFERIRRLQARFDGLCERIEAGYAEVPEAEGLAEIDAAVAASRAGR